MNLRRVVMSAFPRNRRILTGRPVIMRTTTAPSGSAPKGTLAINATNNYVYIYNGSSWVRIDG